MSDPIKYRFINVTNDIEYDTVSVVRSQSCPVDIPDAERRDCHPWPNNTEVKCSERGCLSCAPAVEGPWCFYNTKACPSEIAEEDRVDCMPEGGERNDCLVKNCLWCDTDTQGIPSCFADPDNSLGGAVCPADIPESERTDCHPDQGANEAACLQRGCYWCVTKSRKVPSCFAPRQIGYRMQGMPAETHVGWRVNLTRVNTPSWFGGDVQQLMLDVEFHTETRLRIKFYDPVNERFEVPVSIPAPGPKEPNPLYDVIFSNDPVFSFRVIRISTGATIFDSSFGGFQFADQFIQIGTRLNSDKVYGFGEQEHPQFPHIMDWTWPMWARDQWVTQSNLYGVQPFYLNVEQSHDAHGVLFLNANAQEVTLMPVPGLVYRTIGGILDMYFFLGPTPDGVTQQFTAAVGYPVMPPYWALGFQLCRFGYNNLENMQAAVDRMRMYDIPHDVQYGDIDIMDGRKDFTIDPINFAGLEDYVLEIKAQGTRFITILDPAIYNQDPPGAYPPYDSGNTYDVWVRDPSGQQPQEGQVWPGPVFFPDYLKPATEEWWTNEIVTFKQRLDFAGLWIDMNEPANFVDGSSTGCINNKWNFPPYIPSIGDGLIYRMTLCADTTTELGLSYNTHSLYGWSMAKQTLPAIRAAMPGERTILFSRSTFPGAGQWSQHWLGDNWSRWSNLRTSIVGMLEFNMFGIPYVGADICGFHETPTEELCRRWQMLGAFYPFSRNHNGDSNPDQDPGIWPSVAADTRKALLIRYRLLPYLYTLFHRAHTTGSTVVRSMMMEFTSDPATHNVTDQFLWGSALLISPVLDQGTTSVNAYFPDYRWFDYYTGAEEPMRGGYSVLDTPHGDINLNLRGGYILPVQQPANSTVFSRNNPMGLLVALDDSGAASGDLFWDDGESLDTYENGLYFEASYSVTDGTLTASVVFDGYPDAGTLVVDDVEVFGAGSVTSVTINGATHSDWDQDAGTSRIIVRNAGLVLNSAFTLAWS